MHFLIVYLLIITIIISVLTRCSRNQCDIIKRSVCTIGSVVSLDWLNIWLIIDFICYIFSWCNCLILNKMHIISNYCLWYCLLACWLRRVTIIMSIIIISVIIIISCDYSEIVNLVYMVLLNLYYLISRCITILISFSAIRVSQCDCFRIVWLRYMRIQIQILLYFTNHYRFTLIWNTYIWIWFICMIRTDRVIINSLGWCYCHLVIFYILCCFWIWAIDLDQLQVSGRCCLN